MKDLRGNDYINSEDVIENVDELENDIQTLKEELDELTQELDFLEGDINALSYERNRQRQELDILVSDRTEREDKGLSAADIAEKIEDTNTRLRETEDTIKANETDIDMLNGRINRHRERISETKEELKPYKDLAEQCQNYGDWKHGTRLIRKKEFKNYAQEFAEDIGAVDKRADWPMNCIDWDQAANELENDYSSFYFDGEEYLMMD